MRQAYRILWSKGTQNLYHTSALLPEALGATRSRTNLKVSEVVRANRIDFPNPPKASSLWRGNTHFSLNFGESTRAPF